TATLCSWDGVVLPLPARVSSSAAPCRDTGLVVGQRSATSAELLLPWSALPLASSQLELSWSITGADQRSASSRPDGSHYLAAGVHASHLEAPKLAVRARADIPGRRWYVHASLPDAYAARELEWTQWHLGQRINTGTVALADGATSAEWSLPLTPHDSAV